MSDTTAYATITDAHLQTLLQQASAVAAQTNMGTAEWTRIRRVVSHLVFEQMERRLAFTTDVEATIDALTVGSAPAPVTVVERRTVAAASLPRLAFDLMIALPRLALDLWTGRE